jgi:hypothetical protein
MQRAIKDLKYMNYIRYAVVFTLLTLAIPLIVWAIEWASGYSLTFTAMGVVPVMGAAMYEGQYYVRTAGAAPASSVSWRFARNATAVVYAVSIILTFAALLILRGELLAAFQALMSDAQSRMIFGAILLVLMLVVFLTNRLFFGMGAKNEAKVLAKRAQ